MKLEGTELGLLTVTSQVAKGAGGAGGLSSPGAVIMLLLALAMAVLVVPWRPFFGWGFLYSYWMWFEAVDCLIIGIICGLWAVRRRRHADLRSNSAAPANPF